MVFEIFMIAAALVYVLCGVITYAWAVYETGDVSNAIAMGILWPLVMFCLVGTFLLVLMGALRPRKEPFR